MVTPYWYGGTCIFAASATAARDLWRLANPMVPMPDGGARPLPYPAMPQLNPHANPDGCPPFCHTPDACAGASHCRRRYACTE